MHDNLKEFFIGLNPANKALQAMSIDLNEQSNSNSTQDTTTSEEEDEDEYPLGI
jgi:hypothetical protein